MSSSEHDNWNNTVPGLNRLPLGISFNQAKLDRWLFHVCTTSASGERLDQIRARLDELDRKAEEEADQEDRELESFRTFRRG